MSEQYSMESQHLAQLAETRKVAQAFRELAARVLPHDLRGRATCSPTAVPIHGEYPIRELTFVGTRPADERGYYNHFELRDDIIFGYLEPEQFDYQSRRSMLSNQDPTKYGDIPGPYELSTRVRHVYSFGRTFGYRPEVTYMRDGDQVAMSSGPMRVLGLDGSSEYEQTDALQMVFDEMTSETGAEGNVDFFASLSQEIDRADAWRPALRRLIDGALQGLDDEKVSRVVHMRHARTTAEEMLSQYPKL